MSCRAARWIALVALCAIAPRAAAAQTVHLEPFAGAISGPSVTVGASVWQTGMGVVGLRGTGAWISEWPDGLSGGLAHAGLLLTAPVAGGPVIRPFLSLDLGVAKLQSAGAYPFLRPAIGVIFRPGAQWSYVLESGLSVNRGRGRQWSLLAGVMFSRMSWSRRHQHDRRPGTAYQRSPEHSM